MSNWDLDKLHRLRGDTVDRVFRVGKSESVG